MRGMIGSALRSIEEAQFVLFDAHYKENNSTNVLAKTTKNDKIYTFFKTKN